MVTQVLLFHLVAITSSSNYLTLPGSDWLVADFSFSVLLDMSRIVYNYFNHDDPFLKDPLEKVEADLAESEDSEPLVENDIEVKWNRPNLSPTTTNFNN